MPGYNKRRSHNYSQKEERVMANPFVHVELATIGEAKAKAFYTWLFDWKLEEIPGRGVRAALRPWGVGRNDPAGLSRTEDRLVHRRRLHPGKRGRLLKYV